MRDMKKLAELGSTQLRKYDELSLSEIAQFYEAAKHPRPHMGAIFEVMDLAYCAGYAAGIKAAKAKKKSRRAVSEKAGQNKTK